VAFFLVFVQVLCALLVFQADKSWYTSYDDGQRIKVLLIVLLNIAGAALLIHRGNNLLTSESTNKTVIVALNAVYFIVMALVLYKTYLLAVDGRYVSFPFELAVIPVTGLLGLACVRCLVNKKITLSNINFNSLIGRNPKINQQNEQIGWLIILYAGGLVVGEIRALMTGHDFIMAYPDLGERLGWAVTYTLSNCQLLGWLACLAVFALSLLASAKQLANQDKC
jgi:hypothetical protein